MILRLIRSHPGLWPPLGHEGNFLWFYPLPNKRKIQFPSIQRGGASISSVYYMRSMKGYDSTLIRSHPGILPPLGHEGNFLCFYPLPNKRKIQFPSIQRGGASISSVYYMRSMRMYDSTFDKISPRPMATPRPRGEFSVVLSTTK
jgi:hypothetical protein